ncbi:uncharacterized protein LOC111106968 isoform X2 [Crassostrea virginica]
MTSSHERSRSICSLLALLSFMQCRETALSVDYLGTYEYEEVKWLLRSEKRCSFIPYDTSEYFKESENAKTPCRIFVKPLWARDKEHEISRHHVQYHAYGAKYNYDFTTVNCSTTSDRKLDMLILCEGETVTNRTTCRTDSECGETETCRKHLDMDQQICIPTRHLYETCDDSSSCKNSECRGTDRNRSCQCPRGMSHTASNGQIECLKSNLSLGQSCVHDMQCKGTRNAEKCLNGECFCEEGFVLQRLRCLPDRRRIDEACEGHLQCSGTVNTVCGRNKLCTCKQGFIKTYVGCLQGNLSLGQTCIYDKQCMATDNERRCHNGECSCAEDYVLHKLKCLPGGRRLGESCDEHIQCIGTVNAGVCGKNKTCTCNEGSLNIQGECLQGNLSLGQTCIYDIQCMATDNERRCHNGECSCEEDYVLHKLKCLPGGRRLGESCDEHIQCIGTVNAGVCGKNKTCTCNEGSLNIQGECLQGNLSLGQTCIYDKQCTDPDNGRKCLNGECFCAKGYVLQRLRCLPGNLSLDQACKHDVQCTATENSGRCIDGKCFCAEGHNLQKLRCIPDTKPVDEASGEHHKKNESKVSDVCVQNKTFTCDEGFIKIDESCKQGNLSLDQYCAHDAQCTSTENGGRCLNGKCSCKEGFALHNLRCVPCKRASFISWITEHGVYLMTGSGVICIIVICSAILVVLNRRKSGKMRAPPTTQHSIAERSGFQNIPNEIQLESLYSDPIDSHWRKEEE